jgi:tRNA dimethylallyltransferase
VNRRRTAVALFGPTGVGKTEVAVELARVLEERGGRAAAVSADAFQVYEGLDLLAAKPNAAELEALDHRLLSFVPIEERERRRSWSAALGSTCAPPSRGSS